MPQPNYAGLPNYQTAIGGQPMYQQVQPGMYPQGVFGNQYPQGYPTGYPIYNQLQPQYPQVAPGYGQVGQLGQPAYGQQGLYPQYQQYPPYQQYG